MDKETKYAETINRLNHENAILQQEIQELRAKVGGIPHGSMKMGPKMHLSRIIPVELAVPAVLPLDKVAQAVEQMLQDEMRRDTVIQEYNLPNTNFETCACVEWEDGTSAFSADAKIFPQGIRGGQAMNRNQVPSITPDRLERFMQVAKDTKKEFHFLKHKGKWGWSCRTGDPDPLKPAEMVPLFDTFWEALCDAVEPYIEANETDE